MTEALKQQQEQKVIESKFGKITVNPENAIYCPYGIIGMPEQISFAIAQCPVEKFSQFKLLQSLVDESLVFLSLPIDWKNTIIKEEDLREAADISGITEEDLAILLIASTKLVDGKKVITVNARAPLLIDVNKKAGLQFVLPSSDYDVQTIV